jgi:glycosyltransferase involved in cell wall biosynthesis
VNQNTPEDFEVIIVDSSADGTADIVAQQFSKVRLLPFQSANFREMPATSAFLKQRANSLHSPMLIV